MEAARKTCAAVAGREVIEPSEILIGKRSRPVYGTLSAEAALARLLVGTGLRAETVDGAFVIRRETGGDMTTSSSAEPEAIIVTGSRIRNVPVANPVITLDKESSRDSGKSTVADAFRTIPQNFGGGPTTCKRA